MHRSSTHRPRIVSFAAPTALAIAIVWTATPPASAQNPWTRSEGDGFVQLSAYSIGAYDRLYSNVGDDRRLNREITDTTIEAYGEYGLTDRWTLLAIVPGKQTEAGDLVPDPTLIPTTGEAGTFDALGNVVVSARRSFSIAHVALAGQVTVEVPTGDYDEATGLRTGLDAVTVAPTFAAGKSFGRTGRTYVSGYAGFGLRSGDYSSDWRVGFEGGVRFLGRVSVAGTVDVRQSFENGDVEVPRANLETGLYLNDQEWVAYGVKVAVDVAAGFAVQGTYWSAADGNNVPKAGLAGLGVSYRWGR